jgi:hypothetical protein
VKRNNMYSKHEELNCKHCGADVLQDINNSIVVIHQEGNTVTHVFPCCKGACDDALGSLSGWKELKDFTNPYLYLKHVMAVLNNMHEGMEFTDEAFEGYKQVLIKTAPYVFRDMGDDEMGDAALSNILPF